MWISQLCGEEVSVAGAEWGRSGYVGGMPQTGQAGLAVIHRQGVGYVSLVGKNPTRSGDLRKANPGVF